MVKRTWGTFAAITIALFVVAVAVYLSMGASVVTYESKRAGFPHSPQSCVDHGGVWRRLGGTRNYCQITTKDSGKICASSADCEGACLAAANDLHGKSRRAACSGELVIYGCHAELEQEGVFNACRD
jgi:hypothetical protein